MGFVNVTYSLGSGGAFQQVPRIPIPKMVPERRYRFEYTGSKTHDIFPPLLMALQPFAVPLEALETTNGEGRIPPTSCQRHQKLVENGEASSIFRLLYLDNTQLSASARSQPSDRQIVLTVKKQWSIHVIPTALLQVIRPFPGLKVRTLEQASAVFSEWHIPNSSELSKKLFHLWPTHTTNRPQPQPKAVLCLFHLEDQIALPFSARTGCMRNC